MIRKRTKKRLAAYSLCVAVAAVTAASLLSPVTAAEEPRQDLGLPDFSRSGYQGGGVALPDPNATIPETDFRYVPVTRWGAKANDNEDDTEAFQNAITAAEWIAEQAGEAVVGIPEGHFILSDVLHLGKDNISLVGSSEGRTILKVVTPTNWMESTPDHYRPGAHHGAGGAFWLGYKPETAAEADSVATRTRGAFVADVDFDADRGDTDLRLSSVEGLTAGDYVVLEQAAEPGDPSLGLAKHAGIYEEGPCASRAMFWPVKIAKIKGNNTIVLDQPLRLPVNTSWSPTISHYTPVENVGLRDLIIHFPGRRAAGHHINVKKTDYYNAVLLAGAHNAWAQNVTVTNADSGFRFSFGTKQSTLSNVRLDAPGITETAPYGLRAMTGHYGISAISAAHDNVVDGFGINTIFAHDISVNQGASGNVFKHGWGVDLTLDHHRFAPYENLFSNINLGEAIDPFFSGGSNCARPNSGARQVFWNVYDKDGDHETEAPRSQSYPDQPFPEAFVIPADDIDTSPEAIKARVYMEIVDGGVAEPRDLHAAQVAERNPGLHYVDRVGQMASRVDIALFENGTADGRLKPGGGSPNFNLEGPWYTVGRSDNLNYWQVTNSGAERDEYQDMMFSIDDGRDWGAYGAIDIGQWGSTVKGSDTPSIIVYAHNSDGKGNSYKGYQRLGEFRGSAIPDLTTMGNRGDVDHLLFRISGANLRSGGTHRWHLQHIRLLPLTTGSRGPDN